MELILNATLAGGVAVGSVADIICTPYAAMLIGYIGGILSSIGFKHIGPWLSDVLNVQDTCGVNSLHGMPGIFATLVSMVAIALADGKGFSDDYWPAGSISS